MIACRFFLIVLLVFAVSDAVAAKDGRAAAADAFIKRNQIIFFAAKGDPDSCGPGCSEWIAAEGSIDIGAAKRFQDFLASQPRRDVPVFLNSEGGIMGEAMVLAQLLRLHRMTVAVGRTIPEGCKRANIDQACRSVMQSKREHKARLIAKDARCLSACVKALLGGSQRRVAQGVKIGVHAARPPSDHSDPGAKLTLDEVNGVAKTHVVELGIDPSLIDAGAQVSSDRMRFLSREEIARFGIETRDHFETAWVSHGSVANWHATKSMNWHVAKSITQPSGPGSDSYRTSTVRFLCSNNWSVVGFAFVYRRELLADETGQETAINVATGGANWLLLNPGQPRLAAQTAETKITLDAARLAAEKPAIVIRETFSAQNERRTRTISFSTVGLSKALEELGERCSDLARGGAPAQATAR
jgi:hypothetical protein